MGLDDQYREPTALGGLMPVYLYRMDVAWLRREARLASRWLSHNGRGEVVVDHSDIVHKLIVDQRRQMPLPLTFRPGRPRGSRRAPP